MRWLNSVVASIKTDSAGRASLALPLMVLLLGMCLSVAASMWHRAQTERQAQLDFQRNVDRIADDIARRVRQPIYGLRGAAGMYAANKRWDRSSFSAYVASRDLPREFPGVRGLGFIQRIERGELGTFIADARADGAPQFDLRQLGDKGHADLYVIKYIEPPANNLGAVGLDIGSERERRIAAEQAVMTGEPTLSGAVTLVQDAQRTPGFLMLVPLFQNGAELATLAQRRNALVGLLFAPIVAAEILQGVVQAQSGLVDFELFDTSDSATPTLVFDSNLHGSGRSAATPSGESAEVGHGAARYALSRQVALPGRSLTLVAHSKPAFDAAVPRGAARMLLALGVLLSVLLAAFAHQQQGNRRRAEALAHAMTADLARLALVAQRTSNAVIITDTAQRITWVNEGFTRLFGHSFEQALGQTPRALLTHPDCAPEALQRLDDAAAAHTGCRVELVNRTRDGQRVFIETELQAARDDRGALIGFVEIANDVTARKMVERELARGRQRLSNIIEGTNIGTWEWNVQTGETVFNERWAEIVGYTLEELGPTSIETWGRLAHPDDLPGSALLLERHFNGELPEYEYEARMRHKDGHWVWVLDRGKLFSRDNEGRPRWMAGTHMDISERKQVERALRASQAFLDQTGSLGGVGGWELDLRTQTLVWSDQTCRIHDLPPGYHPSVSEGSQFYAPEARPVIEKAIADAIAGGGGWDLELPVNTAVGRPIWVRAVGEVEFGDGQPVRLFGAFQDVTAWRALQDEVRRNNELMRSVLESLPCGLSVFDSELKLVVANAEFQRVLDLPDALFEHQQLRYDDLIRFTAERGEYGSGDVDQLVHGITERARLPARPYRFEHTRHDGVALEIQSGPMPGGGFVTTYADVSQRRQAEADMARSAALLRVSIETIDEAFVIYDPDDRLVMCNDKYRQIYANVAHLMVPGNTFEQIIRLGAENGDYAEAVGRVDDWVAERLVAHRSGNTTLVQRLSTGRTLRIIERKTPDGCIVGFRVDISELVQATEAAEAASKAKSQFLANMSHEIRTPMNAILGMLTLLRKTELNARQADYASKTEGAARSLLDLLNDILDFSKVEAGKMTLDEHPFGVDALLQDLFVIVSANVGPKPVTVRFDIAPALPRHLVGDAMRLQQVLVNLCGNAIKFTAQGEVVLSMTVLAQDSATVTLEVAVRDTGIGIAPENQARIFSGFTQAEASTTRRFGGTGLGVAISQRLVALMGSELKLESALGQGSRFFFCITLALDPAAASSADIEGERPLLHAQSMALPGATARRLVGLRLLVVEDNLNNQQVARELLEDEGASVQIANHGQEAVEAVAAADPPFDVVLMDLQMPVMDGITATRCIRDDLQMSTLPIIAMTANAMASDRDACLAAGMNEHVGKPFDLDHLVSVLCKLAGRHGAAAAVLPDVVLPDVVLPRAVCDAASAAGVQILPALNRLGGKGDIYQRMLRRFLDDLASATGALQAGAAAFDASAMVRLLHTVKGVAATLGATALAADAARGEQALLAYGAAAAADPALAALCAATSTEACSVIAAAMPGLTALLRALQDEASPAAPAPDESGLTLDLTVLGQGLHHLAELLRQSDMAAFEALAGLPRPSASAFSARLQALDEAIHELDFDSALRQCEVLIEMLSDTTALQYHEPHPTPL